MDTLTNVGTAYDAIPASKGLGFAEIDFTGVTQVVFTVYQSRIGTGVITWQLWNVTDGLPIGIVTTALNGDLYLTDTFPVVLSGIKRVRVRCMSTIATDDPLYYGSTIRLVKS